MQEYLECICCGAKNREIISKTGRNFTKLTTVICTGCGLIHSDPIPTKEELKNFYERDYRLNYKSVPEPLLKHTLRYAKDSLDFLIEILSFCRFENMNQKNFLDIGAGSGEILYFAKKIGFNTKGIEPNKGYALFCKNKLNLNVINSVYEEAFIELNHFDVLNLNQVLEHMPDPLDVLIDLKKFLKEDGILVLTVPNIEANLHSPQTRFHYAHIFNYNHLNLKKLFVKAGYQILNPDTEKTRIYAKKIMNHNNQKINFDLKANYRKIDQILKSKNPLKHYRSSMPYKRFLKKCFQYPKELILSLIYNNHKKILDKTYRSFF
tara:strand:- start:1569 stop:2531 length:963 start_codon:yes stop_codon:yes gene_type:complete